MKALVRRVTRLAPIVARQHPSPRPPADLWMLTAEEMEEAGRISGIVREGGWDALSDDDLDLAITISQKVARGTADFVVD